MKITLSKKEARLMLACVEEIQSSLFWYNEDAGQVIGKSAKGCKALSELQNTLERQCVETYYQDPIYTELLVEMKTIK